MFQRNQVFPGITHIQDSMGVCFTLLEGSEKTMLIDAGYGLENVQEYISGLTVRPVSVVLTHGHHDHILGGIWFREAWLCREDRAEYNIRTSISQRKSVSEQAKEKGLFIPPDYLTAPMAEIRFFSWTEEFAGFSARRENLGGLDVLILHVPGHTEGSIVIYIPKYRLLLTGDDWNPCTWMWFPCSLPVQIWHRNMTELLNGLEKEGGTEKILCSHQPMIREGTELKEYLLWVSPSVLEGAERSDISREIRVHRAVRPEKGWELMFDAEKAGISER